MKDGYVCIEKPYGEWVEFEDGTLCANVFESRLDHHLMLELSEDETKRLYEGMKLYFERINGRNDG